VFEVVKNQQSPPFAEQRGNTLPCTLTGDLAHPKRCGNRGRDRRRIADDAQIDKGDLVREV
jgi:hypothetical protein